MNNSSRTKAATEMFTRLFTKKKVLSGLQDSSITGKVCKAICDGVCISTVKDQFFTCDENRKLLISQNAHTSRTGYCYLPFRKGDYISSYSASDKRSYLVIGCDTTDDYNLLLTLIETVYITSRGSLGTTVGTIPTSNGVVMSTGSTGGVIGKESHLKVEGDWSTIVNNVTSKTSTNYCIFNFEDGVSTRATDSDSSNMASSVIFFSE